MAQNELGNFINKLNKAIRSEKNLRTAISTVLAVHKPRIFEQGEDVNGSKIGTYSTKAISISRKNQARQTGKTYFSGGYAQYKSSIGKNPGYVILRNTDQMMNDYGIVRSGSSFGIGFQNRENYNKSVWMQEKYDTEIFGHSDKEIDIIADVLVDQIIKQL